MTPGIALEVGSPCFTLSLGYAPRLTIPFDVGGLELAVLNRATLRAVWRADPLWTVTALGLFVFGDYLPAQPGLHAGRARPAPARPEPGPLLPDLPVRRHRHVAAGRGELSARSRIRLAGGYFDVGGTGAVGEANQPRAWGPQGEVAFAWDASRNAVLKTAANSRIWMSGSEYFLIARDRELDPVLDPDLETTLAAGAAWPIATWRPTAAGHLVPVALASLVLPADVPEALRPFAWTPGLAPSSTPTLDPVPANHRREHRSTGDPRTPGKSEPR